MHDHPRRARIAVGLLLATLGAALPGAQAAPLSTDEAAALLLNSANLAFNDGKYDVAIERFREFLKLYGSHRDAARAEFGIGMALIEARQDAEGAAPVLEQATRRGDFNGRAHALYYLGVARRGLGDKALALAAAKPAEAEQHRNAAAQRFAEAAAAFLDAATAFLARAGSPSPAGEPAPDLDWAARARCDGTDLLLRLGRHKEAAEAADAFLKEAALGRSQYRDLAIYQHGYARFGLKEYLTAGRSLSQLAPFGQPFGTHARYLLGRIHHLAEQRPEAALQYRAALADYDQRRKAAQTAMQNPAALPPEPRAVYEALLREPAPEYLARAAFYLALIACETERYGEALDGFTAFIQQNPSSPYLGEAQLRQGYCRMQQGKGAEAIAALQPLTNQPPRADRALWWLARCQITLADPKVTNTYDATMKTATDNLRRAADIAAQLGQTDADARLRRGEILMDLADAQVAWRQYRAGADTYQSVLQESPPPTRAEEAMQRRVAALHLGGFHREADDLAAQFETAYPNSVLLPAVLYRRAENAYLVATAVATNTAAIPNRAQELTRLFGEALTRYWRIIERYPDSRYVNLARDAAGACYHRLGRYKDAADVFRDIPADAYADELADVPYFFADSLIRSAPQDPTDAIAAADLLDKARQAAKLLERFIGATGRSPHLPDALLKQGWCWSRIAELVQHADERKQALASARAAFDMLIQNFAQDPSVPVAIHERATCQAALGDVNGAIAELNRFVQDAGLRHTATAPLALTRLAVLLRAQNRGQEAAAALQQYRALCETNLLADAALSNTVASLHYEHALALKQAGKTADARALLENVVRQYPGHPAAANAAWRATQTRREELSAQVEAARQAMARPGAKPEEIAAAQRSQSEAFNGIRDAVYALQAWADTLGKTSAGSPGHLAALYEIAWACRTLADEEIATAVRQLQQDAVTRMRLKLAAQTPAGTAPAAIRPPDIAPADVAMPLSERTALETYERLLAAAPASPLAAQARLEMAELYTQRAQYESAAQVLMAALNQRPPPELVPQIRIRLAAAWLGFGKPNVTLVQAEAVAAEAASPLAVYARYLQGEAFFKQEEWKRAIDTLQPFRDQGPLMNLPDLSDRALLRLGQAYLKTAQYDLSRQALDLLMQRFPASAWVDEALYTRALGLQKQEQNDQAVETFRQVVGRTASAWGAQAQLQIGRCRLAQKRPAEALQAFLAVPFTYEYPDWQASAYLEAARACQDLKRTEEAIRYLQKVTQQYADTTWAQTARDQLRALEQHR